MLFKRHFSLWQPHSQQVLQIKTYPNYPKITPKFLISQSDMIH